MNSKPKISVVIPVHNTGELLNDSIGSILQQTLKEIQVICVDDASNDNLTISLLDEFKNLDERVEVITLENNLGAGGARNVGLEHAVGEYVIAFDSDDYSYPQMLETMYIQCENEHLDMSICGSYNVDLNSKGFVSALVFREKEGITSGCFSVRDLGDYALSYWDTAPWNKLVKRSFLNQYGIVFQEIASCNDVYFSIMCALKAERIMYCQNGKPFVEYRMGRKEQISSTRNPVDLIRAFEKIKKDLFEINPIEEQMLISELIYLGCGELLSAAKDEDKILLYDYIKEEIKRSECIDALESGKIKENCINFIENTFESRWFENSEEETLSIEKFSEYFKLGIPICIWGYGKNGMKLDMLFKDIGGCEVLVTDKKNIMVGKKTKFGSTIIDCKNAIDSQYVIVASKREIFDYLYQLKNENKYRFTVVKGY